VCIWHFLLQLQSNGTRDVISPLGVFNNTFPFTISFSLPLPFPHPILSRLSIPLPILCSLPIPGPFLTTLRVLLTFTIVIVIAITRLILSPTGCTGIGPVLFIIILIDYLIQIQWSNGQQVAWLVLLAAWRLNYCPEIIATRPRGALTTALHHLRAGCLQIGAIDFIPKGTGVVPHPNVHFVTGFVKHLPHIWVEGSPTLL